MKNLLKHSVPHSLPGSPSYFRSHLQDTMVRCGVWHSRLFATFTMDGASEVKREEVRDLQKLLDRFHSNLTFADAPCKCMAPFVRRFETYFRAHIKPPGNAVGLLGKVEHCITRSRTAARCTPTWSYGWPTTRRCGRTCTHRSPP
jgi:hypothetical protein